MVKLQNSESKKKTKKVVLFIGVIVIVVVGILPAFKLTKNDFEEKSATEADAYEIENQVRIPWMLVRFRDIQPK